MKDTLRLERDFATVLLFLVWGPIVIAYILWAEGRSSKREGLKNKETREQLVARLNAIRMGAGLEPFSREEAGL